MGVLATDCPCLAEDMAKIFEVLWALGGEEEGSEAVPQSWPQTLETTFNRRKPMMIHGMETYLASSPEQLCPEGREVQFGDSSVMWSNPSNPYRARLKGGPQVW